MSYQHILVAVDLSESSQLLVNKAAAQAQANDSTLSIVFVDVQHIMEGHEKSQQLKDQLQILADQCEYPVTNTSVIIGDLDTQITSMVYKHHIDLVVCGHHHNVLSRIFSSARQLINSVKTDLLVVYLEQ